MAIYTTKYCRKTMLMQHLFPPSLVQAKDDCHHCFSVRGSPNALHWWRRIHGFVLKSTWGRPGNVWATRVRNNYSFMFPAQICHFQIIPQVFRLLVPLTLWEPKLALRHAAPSLAQRKSSYDNKILSRSGLCKLAFGASHLTVPSTPSQGAFP